MRRLPITRSGAVSRRCALLFGLAGACSLLLATGAPATAGDGLERPSSSSDRGRMAARGEPRIAEGVAGRLVTRGGRPIAGALIVPTPAGGGASPVPEMAVQTDAQGRFEWSLGRGRYRIDAVSDGRTVASTRVTVARGRVTMVRLTAGSN